MFYQVCLILSLVVVTVPATADGTTDDAALVGKLIEQLSSTDGSVRGRAAFQLGKLGDKAAPSIPHLITQFGDLLAPVVDPSHDYGTQISVVAMNSLAQIGALAVQPLIDAMLEEQTRRDRRACCAVTLGMIKDPRSIDPLIQALSDDYQGLRHQAGMALQQIGMPALDKITVTVNDNDPRVRLGATRGLAGIPDARATKLLIDRLGDTDHKVRYAAAGGLRSRTGDEVVVDALIGALGDPHKEARAAVYTALCNCKDPRLLDHFLVGMNDPHKVVRWRCAEALGSQKAKAGVPLLLDALKSDDQSLRNNAARSLGRIGDKRALNVLIELARTDPEADMRVTAGRAIGEIEHPKRSRGEVAWGEAVDGIQLGLRCNTGSRPYRIGEVIRFERLIRNQSDREWKFKVRVGGRIIPHLKDGKISLHSGSIVGGILYVRTVMVGAGQVSGLDITDFIIQSPETQVHSRLSDLRLKPGKYAVDTRLVGTLFGSAHQPDTWTKTLTTGEVELLIRRGVEQ